MEDNPEHKPGLINSSMNQRRFELVCLIMVLWSLIVNSQIYIWTGPDSYYETNFEIDQACGCTFELYCVGAGGFGGSCSTSPDDAFVYQGTNPTMGAWDPITCTYETLYSIPDTFPQTVGLVAIGGGLFYTMDDPTDGSMLYIWNINNFTLTPVGSTGYLPNRELCHYNGNFYHLTDDGIVQIDTANPQNSVLIQTEVSLYNHHHTLTASPFCNSLLSQYGVINGDTNTFTLLNVLDGTVTDICSYPDWQVTGILSPLEYVNPAPCELWMDLDCDDSDSWSYFNCSTLEGVPVTDDDIRIFADTHLDNMTITITDPIPDDPYEILLITGPISNISASGIGTSMITLNNTGSAAIYDFRNALKLIAYQNLASPPTPGVRTIEVRFVTQSGAESNISEFFIDVEEFIYTDVDLGPDQEVCEGIPVIIDAGNPGASYAWSTGETSQTITVDQSGQYIVTVNDGINCPGSDTVVVDMIPVISVSLTGDAEICNNETANLTINTNTPFPLTIEISADPGSPFIFTDVTGDFNFTDLPTDVTEYTITNVTSSQPACIEITNPTFIIEVFPSYIQEQEVSLCDGDSIWLGFFWESDAGVYENLLQTEYGCDSFVTTYITIFPAENIFFTSTTCDSSEAGVFVTHLDNPNGCDTVVTTTVTLLPSDTTNIHLASCNISNTGVSILTLSNQAGCDSLIITTTSWIPPSDTTILNQTTCDSSLLGVFQQILPDQTGCDSMIITTVTMAPDDTTHLATTSCDTSAIGVFEMLLSNQMGCDSLIITTVSPGTPDTTLLFATSCDSASLGIFETHFIASNGCDSTVISTITYSAQDSVFITGTSCDPSDVGVFIFQHTNQFGCDSIVTETISLLPSDVTFINSSTCDSSAAGVFTQMLTNQFGCDSVVTETVMLLPSDETFLNSTTCISSEAGVFITNLANQFGCDSVITETVTLLPTDSTILAFNTCDPAQVGHIETLHTGQDGCDSLVIESTSLFPLPQLDVESVSDFNGYDISCFGESDGSASALVQGIPPYSYTWSTGDTGQTITGLAAGAYQVSVTDANGCTTEGQIILVEPGAFEISFIVSQPDCFGVQEGSIMVSPTGGVAPYRYSIDGTNYQTSSNFTGLGEGVYQISSLDANDCITSEIIWINVPLMVEVELGDDQVISKGDSFLLQAIVNIPFDSLSSVIWTGIDSIDCPNCLTQLVAPIITTSYSVSVTTEDGCADKDSMTLFVHQNDDIYVPNIFSPNGDNINDHLTITAGPDVEEIESFSIFDRWGNMVFLAEHFQADDPAMSWDGSLKGERMNAAVFTYKMVAAFKDGRREVKYGDITLIR